MTYRKIDQSAHFLLIMILMLISGLALGAAQPSWQTTQPDTRSLNLVFQMPLPEVKDIQKADQIWHTFDIPGSVIQASIGEPGLPVFSRLIAVPQGMSLSVEVISATSSTISDLHILPVQDPSTEKFSILKSAYQNKVDAPATVPIIKTGAPAIMAGQTVVPLTISPVVYDAANQEAVIWTETQLKLEFIPDPNAPTSKGAPRTLPRSFVNQMENQVLGFQAANQKSSSETANDLGTYVAVHSGHSTVRTGIAPLLQWRREQGYHVIEMNTSIFGGNAEGIKNALKNIYENETIPPLEFITIFGDVSGSYPVPAWTETLSGYHGGGDHYYTMLDGDDILADAHIGRVSFTTEAEMNTVVGKILGYEQTPPMDETGWYGRACLQGDPSASGITTIYTNQWLKGQLLGHGWAQVDTTWSGNFVTPMMAQVGQGVTAYGYRGYLGTSGISNGHVTSLNNGGRLAVALLPTCDSGSFANSTACRSEAWLRAPNGGAVAAIGTATTGTHTRYNNCYYLGTWDGLINSGDHRVGVAHTQGKMALYSGYYLAEPSRAEIWAVWNNVMGDAATEM